MGMTIDESLKNLEVLQADYRRFHDGVWQDPESYGIIAESLRVVIDVMKKYQKIEEIVKNADTSSTIKSSLVFSKIKEVVEDGESK